MPAFTATAPGKVILFGEHAVVYHRPAIAVPVQKIRVRAVVEPDPRRRPGQVHILAPDIGLDACLDELPAEQPLAATLHAVCRELGISRVPACRLRVTSSIPVASGFGSGAAVSVAVIRAFSAFLGQPLSDDRVSALAFEVEKIHHGTPSGIDNTVITYAMPVYFVRGQPPERFKISKPFILVIGDTGIASSTSLVVGDVRQAWQANPAQFEYYFDAIGAIVQAAREAIESGRNEDLGRLMQENHLILQKLGVSSPELDHLVEAALSAGARGAKLSGAGRGGNMLALVDGDLVERVEHALRTAGAVRTIVAPVE